MYFSSKNGFKILKYIAEGNTFIVNYQLSIVNFYRANGAKNRNLNSKKVSRLRHLFCQVWSSIHFLYQ